MQERKGIGMNSALDVAKYIIHYCTLSGKPISNIQLQKILYYVQLNFYRILDRAAFRESIEAWQYGPVVPIVYDKYKQYGAVQICQFDFGIQERFSNMEIDLINKVIELCISVGPWELVNKSHKIGGPWEVIYKGHNQEIPDKIIREYAKEGKIKSYNG